MTAVDTNVLVYAHFPAFPKHEAACRALTDLAVSPAPWAIPVFCLGEFLRVVTHPRVISPPMTTSEALEAVARLEASPRLTILGPGPGYMALLREAMKQSGATGNLVYDAQVVAVCRESGVRSLLTEDRDYDRFKGFPVTRLPAPA